MTSTTKHRAGLRSDSDSHFFDAARCHEIVVSDGVAVRESSVGYRYRDKENSGDQYRYELSAKSQVFPTTTDPDCVIPETVHSCLHNDYYSEDGTQHGSSRLPQIVSIQRRINLQCAFGRILDSVCRSFRDDFWPLLNRAARVANRSSDCRSIVPVIRQYIGLSHSAEGTAC